jgi:propionyl-CoA synthetase
MEIEKNAYTVAYEKATNEDTREEFWKEEAKNVKWKTFPTKILDSANPPFYYWYPDGEINICENTIDRHLEDKKKLDEPAVIWVSNMVNIERTYTWKELYENVCKFAKLLKEQGVEKGDRVIVFMPMIPEAIFAVMAIARLGAIHSIVFGGFAAKELASRMTDSTPKVVVTTNYGL